MKYDIAPLEGVGDVRFGMRREEVAQLAGSNGKDFKRTPESRLGQFFNELDMFAYYDENGELEALEFTSSAPVTLGERRLLNLQVADARSALQAWTNEIDDAERGTTLVARELGVALWAPLAKDDASAPVEAIVIFRRGYYDGL